MGVSSTGKARGRPRNTHRVCDNCSKFRKKGEKFIGKLCQACFYYQRNNDGKSRPYWYYIPKEYRICRNHYCGKSLANIKEGGRGYCGACLQYLNRTGKLRLARYHNRLSYKPCKICGDDYDVLFKKNGKCRMCHRFLLRYGKERTQQSIDFYKDRVEYCENQNCGVKLTVWEMCTRGGVCSPCYSFYKRHGTNRPRKMCLEQMVPKRCDCGEEATKSIKLEILNESRERKNKSATQVVLDLCDSCYQLEIKE